MSEERQNASDPLVEAAYAADLGEAALIQGLLETEGVPSVLRPAGVDGLLVGHGILANPPQRVMVHADQVERARTLLADVLAQNEQEAWPEPVNARYLEDAPRRKLHSYGRIGAYARIYLFSFGAMAVAFGVFLLLR